MKTGRLCQILVLCALFTCMIPAVQADESTDLYNEAVKLVNGGGDLQTAIGLLDKALAINSSQFGGTMHALELKSYAQIRLGDYSGALITLDTALAIEETDIIWNNKGYVLCQLGRYEDAVHAYDTAIKITPKYTVALINKGDALMKLGRYQNAVDAYTLALSSDAEANDLTLTQKAKTWKDMGDAYYNLGKYQDAISAYNSALTVDPANAEASAGLARAQQGASAVLPVIIIAVIAIIAIGAGAYYLMKGKKAVESKDKKPDKKK